MAMVDAGRFDHEGEPVGIPAQHLDRQLGHLGQ